jgi:cytochrome P450
MLRGMMMAGIDTTQCAIASAIWHLATHDADRELLAGRPDLVPAAVEEFLRLYAPVMPAREVMREAEVEGCPMRPDNLVLVSFAAANRDPAVFPEPDSFVPDRKDNRHLAFGVGIHRCIGMHLGRAETLIGVEEWLKAFPRFSLAGEAVWTSGQVRGPAALPIAFG